MTGQERALRAAHVEHVERVLFWPARQWRAKCEAGDWTGDTAGYETYDQAVGAHREHLLEVVNQQRGNDDA